MRDRSPLGEKLGSRDSIIRHVPDEPKWFQPGYQPSVTRRPSEPQWTLEKDGRRVACELRGGTLEFGVEVQLTRDGEFYAGRRFETRLAQWHADTLLAILERDGWR